MSYPRRSLMAEPISGLQECRRRRSTLVGRLPETVSGCFLDAERVAAVLRRPAALESLDRQLRVEKRRSLCSSTVPIG
jgi:hypothetical protein